MALLLGLCAAAFVRWPGDSDYRFDPLDPPGRQVELAIETQRFADALPIAQDLRTAYPDDPLVLFWLAEIYRGLDRPKDELTVWDAFLRVSSAPWEACPWLPEAEARAGRADAALRRYHDCVGFAPDNPQRLLDLAAAQIDRGQKHEALLTYAKAAALDPHDPGIPKLMEARGGASGQAW